MSSEELRSTLKHGEKKMLEMKKLELENKIPSVKKASEFPTLKLCYFNCDSPLISKNFMEALFDSLKLYLTLSDLNLSLIFNNFGNLKDLKMFQDFWPKKVSKLKILKLQFSLMEEFPNNFVIKLFENDDLRKNLESLSLNFSQTSLSIYREFCSKEMLALVFPNLKILKLNFGNLNGNSGELDVTGLYKFISKFKNLEELALNLSNNGKLKNLERLFEEISKLSKLKTLKLLLFGMKLDDKYIADALCDEIVKMDNLIKV